MKTKSLHFETKLSEIQIYWLITHFTSLKNEFHTFFYNTHSNHKTGTELYVNTLQKLANVISTAVVFNKPVTPSDLKEIVLNIQELKDQITTSANEEGIQLHELLSQAKDSLIQIILEMVCPSTDTIRASDIGLS